MGIKNLQQTWNQLGQDDPMWAVLVEPGKEGRKWDEDEFFASGKADIDAIMELAQLQKINVTPGRALDFGCGLGRLSQALSGHFQAVDGVDIAPSMIEQARQLNRQGTRVQYHLNEKSDLKQFDDDQFDFVFTTLVLQHMPQKLQLGYISEFLRILKPGGLATFQAILHNPDPEGVRPFKKVVRNLMSREMRRIYWSTRNRLIEGGPAALLQSGMDMYTLEEKEIEAAVTKGGGKIIFNSLEPRCTGDWIGQYYWVRKSESSIS
jgi:ubiquinone/menaquinone biosynthesis C-methylase UbiE